MGLATAYARGIQQGLKVRQVDSDTWRVQSHSTKDGWYTVRRVAADKWRCDCKASEYDLTCKHLGLIAVLMFEQERSKAK